MKELFETLSAERCPDLVSSNIAISASVYKDDEIDENNLYVARFGRIPNRRRLCGIDHKKANEWLLQNYQDKITDCCYDGYNKKDKTFYDAFYFLYDDLLIALRGWRGNQIKFLFRKTNHTLVDKIVDEIKKFEKRSTPQIRLLITKSYGLDTSILEISRPKLSIEENYNDDFLDVHQTITNRLRKQNDKGLVLLHGKPGTGKTSYIRYLVAKAKKRVIFLPPNMAASITDPRLMNVLINNPNSIFVIEDAENIIIDRTRSGSSSVSALLNLADGC